MEDLPTIATAGNVPTVAQQERIAAAIRASGLAVLGDLPIDQETARLIALPDNLRGNQEAVIKAAFATKLRNSHIGTLRARGVALDENGQEIPQAGDIDSVINDAKGG